MSKQFIFVRHERKEGGWRAGGLEGGVSPLVSVCQSDLMDTSVTAGSDSELIFNFPILSLVLYQS